MKRCVKCGVMKSLAEFYAERSARDGRRNDCKACNLAAKAARHAANPAPGRERAKQWNRDNAERYAARMEQYRQSGKKKVADRKSHLKRTFGLTVEQYDEMLAAQGGGCAICRCPPREDSSLHVDHDHRTGRVRGILCFRCNNAIGDLDESIDTVRAALDYLVHHQEQWVKQRVLSLVPSVG